MKLLPFDYATRNAGRNPVRTLLLVIGAGGVVFLVILMGAFVQSMAATMRSTGDPANVIILGKGSEDFLEQSEISPAVASIAAATIDGIAKLNDLPMISSEILHAAVVKVPGTEVDPATHKMLVRGVTPEAFLVHQQVYITEGKMPGAGEILVGGLAGVRLNLPDEALAIGKQLEFENQLWTISGHFAASGTAFDAEVWAPLEELKIQTKRDTYSCAVVRLDSPQAYSDLDFFVKSRLDLEVSAVPETDYYSSLAQFFRPVQVMGWTMAALVTIAGLLSGLNIIIASITSRTRELACLETIGFSRRSIVLSLLQENFIQVGAGTLISLLVATLILSGMAVRFTMGAVELSITPDVLAAGFAAGLVLAVVGTLLPAMRFARRPLIDQLR